MLAGPRVPSGGVTRQGVVLTDLQCVLLCFISTDVNHLTVNTARLGGIGTGISEPSKRVPIFVGLF